MIQRAAMDKLVAAANTGGWAILATRVSKGYSVYLDMKRGAMRVTVRVSNHGCKPDRNENLIDVRNVRQLNAAMSFLVTPSNFIQNGKKSREIEAKPPASAKNRPENEAE